MRISDWSSDVCSSDLSIHHCASTAEITMRVALTSDCGLELDLAYGNAYALLEALGMATDSVGEIPLEQVRNRLADPDTPARAAERGVDHYLPRIERLLASATESGDARLAWTWHAVMDQPEPSEGKPAASPRTVSLATRTFPAAPFPPNVTTKSN